MQKTSTSQGGGAFNINLTDILHTQESLFTLADIMWNTGQMNTDLLDLDSAEVDALKYITKDTHKYIKEISEQFKKVD